ncbi:MAG TPA: ATP-binding protein [Candidatus Aquilonibacter sp.]|nr:ATP-binding protein [Candidatus Aquilonibacter sp.]
MDLRPEQIRQAFEQYDREVAINNIKIGCILGMVLVPSFAIIDYSVYPQLAWEFLSLRLACSALIGVFLSVLLTTFGRRHYRIFGVALVLLPGSCISYMIYRTEGADSPYYAGLNLVLLVVGFVLRWTFRESLIAVSLVLAEYIAACDLHAPFAFKGIVINNLYFLISTGIIVVTGNHFFSQFRFREFVSRYELDASKKELEETNRKLIELDRLKSRFFANISHELRTPLTLLLSPLETLMQRFDPTLDDHAHELLATMQANGMRLLKLINDLLDLIRLEAGRMDVKSEPLDISEFLKGLASAVRQVAENKRLKLEIHVDPELGAVLTDRDKIEKIILNLLFNALKFTPEDGRVWLRAERQGDDFVLIVGDTGVGIAEKNLPFVFDRFWQADSSSKRRFQGVGIGLALVKELAEMLRGSVTVQSQEGRGATFTVRLPYQKGEPTTKPAAAEPLAPAENGAAASEEWLVNLYRRAEFFPAMTATRGTAKPSELAGRRPVVLIADDEPDMRRFLNSELNEDYDVLEAADGVQALEKAQQFLPDIILLDMMMPEMDGLEVCRELRQRDATVNIPIILLTARADEETKFDALGMGANDFLAKPFSSTELQARIKNLIESHHYQRKLTKQNKALTLAIEQIKDTEMQLVQSEKLASLGRLSAGIIHEINNPLNFTLTGLFALRNKGKQLAPEQREEYEAILNDVEDGLKRVRNIVSDLRTFTHPGGGTGEPVDVADVVGASLRFLAGEWKDKAAIEQKLPPDQIVWANRNKLIHVLVNLVQNSIDALAEKKFEGDEKPTIWVEGRMEGDRSLIIVRDNGMGIDPKLVDKIFDPFFTTKEVGKGMGLGLSICYRIVQGYGGTIAVKSEAGKYCEFTIDLPAKDEPDTEFETEHGKSLRS